MKIIALAALFLTAPVPDTIWCDGFPIYYQFDLSVPDSARAEITNGIETWNTISDQTFFKPSVTGKEKNLVTVMWEEESDLGFCGYAPNTVNIPGCTRGRQIFLYADCEKSFGKEWERIVAMHEMGHILGITHSDDPNSVMHATTHRVTTLGPYEKAEIAKRYNLR